MLEKVYRIVELRQAGKTWFQVDQEMFPGTTKEQSVKKSPSWHLAKKAGPAGEMAFSKQVFGMYTPIQIVVKNPKFVRLAAPAKVAQSMTCEFAM